MNESKARHITLIAVAFMELLFFYPYVFIFSGISVLNVQDSLLDSEAYFVLSIFLAVGVCIILSAFSKICFYFFISSEPVFLGVFLSRGFGLDPPTILCLLLFIPILFYYIVRIVLRRRAKKQNAAKAFKEETP